MQFDWPTAEQMIYRLTRLRRLLAMAIFLPVATLLCGSLIDPTFLSPDRATLAAMAVACLFVGHVVLFPNVPLETLSLSVAVTTLTVAAPWIKQLSLLAPAEHNQAALIMLVALSLVALVALTAALQMGFGYLMMVGPVIKRRLRGAIEVPCSAAVARRQFALSPEVRRGRILTGAVDQNGFFEVAILAPQVADPERPNEPMIVRVAAKMIDTTDTTQQTMLVLPNGAVTVTAESFIETSDGCQVEISEMPGDFTAGMHALFWLTDQQMDNLTETADAITGTASRANGLSHGLSMMALVATVLSPKQPVAD